MDIPKPDKEAHAKLMESMGIDPNKLPKPVEPEYMSWPLEKLQREYWLLNLKHLGTKIQNSDENRKVQKAERLIEALKDCLEDSDDV
jgi:hypothetical protein